MEDLGNPILQIKWLNPKNAFSAGFDLSFFRYDHGNVSPVADAGEDAAGRRTPISPWTARARSIMKINR
jgi:hypothetical protein